MAVFDLRVMTIPTMDAVKRLVDFCRAHLDDFSKAQKAISVLLQNNLCSGVVRRLISAVSAAVPPVCPLLICHSMDTAEAFFQERCVAPVRVVRPSFPRTPPVASRTFTDLSDLEGHLDLAATPADGGGGGDCKLDSEPPESPLMQPVRSDRKRIRFASKISFDVQELQADQQALKSEPGSDLERSNTQALQVFAAAVAVSSSERPRPPAKAQQPGPLFRRLRGAHGPSCGAGPLALFSGCHPRCGFDGQVHDPVACRDVSFLDATFPAEDCEEPRACIPHIAKPTRVAIPSHLDRIEHL